MFVTVEARSTQVLKTSSGEASANAVFPDADRGRWGLSPSEEPFQIPGESIPLLFWSARPDGFADYYNARLLEYVGKTMGEIRGWAWTSALHPDDAERSVAAWKETVATGSEYYIEHRIRRASDGQYRWHRTQALAQRDPEGHILRWFGTCTDIHECRHAEEVLRENVVFRKRVFEGSRIPILVFDPATSTIIDCNPAAAEIYGLPCREETLGKSPLELSTAVQYDGTPSFEKARFYTAKALAEGTAIFEWRHQRPNGATWDAKVHLMSFRCGQRQLLQFTLQDITERKRVEYLLAEERRVLKWIAQRRPLPDVLNEICRFVEGLYPGAVSSILLLDAEGMRLWPIAASKLPEEWRRAITPLAIGPAAGSCGTAAWRKEPVVASEIATDPRWANPDHRALAMKCGLRACWSTPILSAKRQTLGTFAIYYQEPRSPLPRDLDLMKQVTHLASIAIDHDRSADALRRSESRYRTLFESAQDSIFLNEGGRLVDCNPITLRMFGCRREDIIGQTPAQFSPTLQPDGRDSAQLAREKINAAYAGVPQVFEWRHCRLDGSEFDAEVSLTRIEAAERPMLVGIVRDITARKEAEEALRRAHDELEHRVRQRTAELTAACKGLETFTAGVSHDLRAPLRAIGGYSEILAMNWGEKFDEEARTWLNSIQAQVQRMGGLIESLLQLSKATRSELRCEPVNLSQLAVEIEGDLRREQPNRRVDFCISPGLVARGDPALLRSVLQNLLGNAWKFTAKSPAAHIEFGQVKEDGKAAYYVLDNGAGFEMERAGKLFAPFQRLHNAVDFPGAGIGLATVQQIIHRHGGKVWASSAPGKGATFYFTLP